jgi:molybdopterin molybdotransferase
MIAVAEARRRILAGLAPVPAEQIGLAEAAGRTLAAPVVARVTQPPAAVSAMDGYAVRAADVANVPVRLAVIGAAPAGKPFAGTVGPGQAVRIFTGAPMPAGSDAVVIQENARAEGQNVLVVESAAPGRHVRRAGLDFAAGEAKLAAGRTLTPRDVGLAAAMNVPWLSVRRRPRITILATGDEIVQPGEPLGPGQIVSSNAWALGAFVAANGGQPVNLGIAPDDEAALRALAAGAAGCDALVTSGGASVGDHDLVQRALGAAGLKVDFWQIAMRPGKPLMFGALGGVPVLGLPGNPVSSMVCALLFLGPMLAALLGRAETDPPRATARLGADLPANDRREDYLRARLARPPSQGPAALPVATPAATQDSSMLATLAEADALIVRAPHAPPAKTGDPVDILPLGQTATAI